MSDLEATSSRPQAAAPITAIASGKLRAFAGNGTLFAETDGLADAFAEVFARIAASSSQPIEPRESRGDIANSQIADDHKPVPSDDGAAPEPESSVSDSETQTNLDPLVAVTDQQATVEDEIGLIDESNHAVEPELESPDKAPDQVVIEDVTVAVVEVNRPETVDSQQTKTPEVIAANVIETEDTNHRKRDRRESPAVDLAEPTQQRGSHHDRAAKPEQNVEISRETDPLAEQPAESTPEHDDAESPRVSRRRYTSKNDASDNATRPVSEASQSSAARRSDTLSSSLPTADAAIDQSRKPSVESSSPASARGPESVVANVQNVAARVDRVNTSGGSQTLTRGSTQAIESLGTKRTEPRTEPNSQPAKKNAAETVSRVKLIQRVSKAFQHLGPEGGVVRLRLAPAEMGAVRVEMRIHQRKVQARVVAETEAATAALREHLPDLRARLESLGMQVEKLEIETDTNDRQQSSLFDADSQQNQQQWQRQNRPRFDRRAAIATEAVSPVVRQTTTGYHVAGVTSGVDVHL